MISDFWRLAQKPVQAQQKNQSHCEADRYISIRTRFLADATLPTDDVAKARVALPQSGLRCRNLNVATQEKVPWPNALDLKAIQ
jgi:hypothetical protein